MNKDKKYSVLMSVYEKEKPDNLRAALESILGQTLRAHEIVLVCDGPLNKGLDYVIEEYRKDLKVVRLPENAGLGKALAVGLQHCECEWVARMDSDDISARRRCELQMDFIEKNPAVDVLSGTVAEFEGAWLSAVEAKKHIVSYKNVPVSHQEICGYIKYRNPLNHPCVMFRKEKVIAAGNYRRCRFFEDYDLWVRMYQNQCVFGNLTEVLLFMRVNDMHKRRGGMVYAKEVIRFRTHMYQQNLINLPQYIYTTAVHVAVSLLPNGIRRFIYNTELRKS